MQARIPGKWRVWALVAAAGLLAVAFFRDSRAGEKSNKGWLGVSVQELTPSAREKMKLGAETGLLVTDVVRDSPAEEAGIREDDVIIQFDGKKVEQAGDFSRLVRNAGADRKVVLTILRKGERKTIEVILGKRRSPGTAWAFAHGSGPGREMAVWMNRPRLGVQVQELNENLAPYFKVEPGSGVLVLEVNEDSPAERAGLQSGDVITRIADEKVRDAEDLIDILRDYEEGDQVEIEYVRQGKSATATAEIEESGDSHYRFFAPHSRGVRVFPHAEEAWEEALLDARPHEFDHLIQDEIRLRLDREINHNIQRELERALRATPDYDRRTL